VFYALIYLNGVAFLCNAWTMGFKWLST